MELWRSCAARALLLLAAGLCLLPASGCVRAGETGLLSVRVTDGWTDAPIENARVVIPESGGVCQTDGNGRTGLMEVPVLRDAHFRHILPQDWGTVTVLVYAEGYYACALYHARVAADAPREDLPIRLFPNDGTLETPFSLIESPDEDWVREMLHRYGS